eukprot:3935415-Rhodomonas_salina.1
MLDTLTLVRAERRFAAAVIAPDAVASVTMKAGTLSTTLKVTVGVASESIPRHYPLTSLPLSPSRTLAPGARFRALPSP